MEKSFYCFSYQSTCLQHQCISQCLENWLLVFFFFNDNTVIGLSVAVNILWLQLHSGLVPHTLHKWSKFKVRYLRVGQFVILMMVCSLFMYGSQQSINFVRKIRILFLSVSAHLYFNFYFASNWKGKLLHLSFFPG